MNNPLQGLLTETGKNAYALLLGIEIGLEELFGGNVDAMQEWLNERKVRLFHKTPDEEIIRALERVNNELDIARGLK